jgi:hypothetical protein
MANDVRVLPLQQLAENFRFHGVMAHKFYALVVVLSLFFQQHLCHDMKHI